jgi:Tfp pilus assembly major pilin PilA
LILGGNQLLDVNIVIGVIVVFAGLAIALVVPCVHHLTV